MRITLLTNPQQPPQGDLVPLLERAGHTVKREAAPSRLRAIAERDKPGLLLVERAGCDSALLGEVDDLVLHCPQVAVILLCASLPPEFLLHAMRVGVREVLPWPANDTALLDAVARVEARGKGHAMRTAGRVLAFIGCKGGSGVTFLASNLAYQLAQGSNVLLIDLNLQHGDALSFVHDARPASTLSDVARHIDRLDAALLAASTVKVANGFSVLAAPEDPVLAADIGPQQLEAILDVAVANYDFVVLDLPRHLDPLTLKALDRATQIHPVLQSGLPYLRGAARLLQVFQSLGYPPERIELLLNRFESGGDIALDTIQRSFGAVTLSTVPNAWREVSAAINHGDPILVSAKANPVARNLATRAMALHPRPVEARGGLLGRLFAKAQA